MKKREMFAVLVFVMILFNCTGLGSLVWKNKSQNGLSAAGQSQSNESGTDYVKVKGDPLAFWRKVMTYDVAYRYQAINWITYCNIFLSDTIQAQLGKEVYQKVFPEGVKAPHIVYEEWKTNPELFRLEPESYTLGEIQKLADDGYLVLLAYYYNMGPSHLAFVGHRDLTFFTIPSIGKMEGESGASIDQVWLPVVVQAGTYTGITSVAFATNGWFGSVNPYDAGLVRFYLVKT
jgi:hypothetical protein